MTEAGPMDSTDFDADSALGVDVDADSALGVDVDADSALGVDVDADSALAVDVDVDVVHADVAADVEEGAARFADPEQLAGAVEAVLFVVEAPVSVTALAAAVQQPVDSIIAALEVLRRGYDERGAGIEVREVAGGVRIYTRPAYAEVVEQFLLEGQRSKLSQAALETLAVIAYRQPVTRARVSAIRGVNVDGVVRTLLARGLIVETGSDPDSGGGLFRTSELFLERMGLRSLEELPSLAPLLPDVDDLDNFDNVDAVAGDE